MLDRPYTVSGTAAHLSVSVRSLLLVPSQGWEALWKASQVLCQLSAGTATAQLKQHRLSGQSTVLSDIPSSIFPISIISIQLFGFVHKFPAKQIIMGKVPAATFPREVP